MQTLNCKLPGGITLGGFEVLSAGTRELAPELLGWYGSPGYLRSQGGSFFLAGDNFSVHETRLIAGNQLIDMKNTTLLSRQVIEVTLPAKPHSVQLNFATEHGPLASQEFTNLAMTSGGLITVQGKDILDLFTEKATFASALKQYVDWRLSSSGISGDAFQLGVTATVQYGGGGAVIAATGKMNCQVTLVKPEDDSE